MLFMKQIGSSNGWNIAIANLHTFEHCLEKSQLGPSNDRVQVWTTVCRPSANILNFIVPKIIPVL